MIRISLALSIVVTCLGAGLGCETKDKLDRTLDEGHAAAKDARVTMKNVNAKLDQLSSVLDKLGDVAGSAAGTKAVAAATAIAKAGPKGGNVAAQGGTPQASNEQVDVDGDGKADDVSTVTYDTTILWLFPVSGADESFCGAASTVSWVLTDKPPTQVLAFGQWDESCGTVACPGNPEEAGYDFEAQCGCQDASGADIACDAFDLADGADGGDADGGGADDGGGAADGGVDGGEVDGGAADGGVDGGEVDGGAQDGGAEFADEAGDGGGEEFGDEAGDDAGEGGGEEGELTCDELAGECEAACADAQDQDEFDLCFDDCMIQVGC